MWWRFTHTDATLWGLAGLWNTWIDQGGGEVNESYTMLTVNADPHPTISRMHKPDPKYGPMGQDKRSVIAIEPNAVQRWLFGTITEASQLLVPPAAALINAKPC